MSTKSPLHSKFDAAFRLAIPSVEQVSSDTEGIHTYVVGGFVRVNIGLIDEERLSISVPVYKLKKKEFKPQERRFLVSNARKTMKSGTCAVQSSQLVMNDEFSSDLLDRPTDFCQYIDQCLESYWAVRNKVIDIKEDYIRRDKILLREEQAQLLEAKKRSKAIAASTSKAAKKVASRPSAGRPKHARGMASLRSNSSSTHMLSSTSSLPSRESSSNTLTSSPSYRKNRSKSNRREFTRKRRSTFGLRDNGDLKPPAVTRVEPPMLPGPSTVLSGKSAGISTASKKSAAASVKSERPRRGRNRESSSPSVRSRSLTSKSEYMAWWVTKNQQSTLAPDEGAKIIPHAPDLSRPVSAESQSSLKPRRMSNITPLRSFPLRKPVPGPPPLTLKKIEFSPVLKPRTVRKFSDAQQENLSPKWWKPVRAPSIEQAPTTTRRKSPLTTKSELMMASPKTVGDFPESLEQDPKNPKWWKPVRAPSIEVASGRHKSHQKNPRVAATNAGQNTVMKVPESMSPKWWKPVRAPSIEPS